MLLPAVEEIVPAIQNADHIVQVLVIDREAGESALLDGMQDLLVRVLHPEAHDLGAVDHHVLRGEVVEIEDVFDHFLFGGVNGSPFLSNVHQEADILLRDGSTLRRRVNAEAAQDLPHHPGQPSGNGTHRRHEGQQTGAERAQYPQRIVQRDPSRRQPGQYIKAQQHHQQNGCPFGLCRPHGLSCTEDCAQIPGRGPCRSHTQHPPQRHAPQKNGGVGQAPQHPDRPWLSLLRLTAKAL